MRRTPTVLVLTVALLATACGGADTAAPASTTAAPTTAAPTTTTPTATTTTTSAGSGTGYAALALTPADFPAEYPAEVLDADTRALALAALSGSGGGTVVSPTSCASTNPFAGADDVAVVEGQDSSGAVTIDALVGRAGEGLDAVAARIARCPSVTVRVTADDGTTASGTGTQAVTPPPPLDADTTLAFTQDLTITPAGSAAVTLRGTTLAAQVGDTVVLVTASTQDGATVDTGLLDELLTAGLQKVLAG